MLSALTQLLIFQLAGEVIARCLGRTVMTQLSLAPKSVTTPIAMGMNGALTALLVPWIAGSLI